VLIILLPAVFEKQRDFFRVESIVSTMSGHVKRAAQASTISASFISFGKAELDERISIIIIFNEGQFDVSLAE
jgi:hypothetical protein